MLGFSHSVGLTFGNFDLALPGDVISSTTLETDACLGSLRALTDLVSWLSAIEAHLRNRHERY